MRRIGVEIPVTLVTAAVIAILVMVAGHAIEPSAQPAQLTGHGVQPAGDDRETCLNAPASTLSGLIVDGGATLCYRGAGLRLSLTTSSLTPGESRVALVTYVPSPIVCGDALCRPLDLPDDRSQAWNLRIDGMVAAPPRSIEVRAEIPDTRVPSGAQISLVLLHPRGQASLATAARFTIP